MRVLLTRVDPRTKDAAEMLEFLTEQKLTVLPTKVCERVAFRRAIGEGATVQELAEQFPLALIALTSEAMPSA